MRWYIPRWGVILTSLVACSCPSMAAPRLKVAKAEKAKIERRIQVVAKPEPAQKIILYASSSGKLKAVHVKTGLTDGNVTAVETDALKEGDEVVLGLATARAMATSGGGMRGGMGRM